MKRKSFVLVALCGLLFVLSGCSTQRFHGLKDTGAIFDPAGPKQPNKSDYRRVFTESSARISIQAINEASQTVWVGFADHALDISDCYQINPGSCAPPEMRRSNDKLRATVIYFEEGGNNDLSWPKRKVSLFFPLYQNQQTFKVTDLMLQGRAMREGFFANSYPWAGIMTDSRKNNYGLIPPMGDTGIIHLATGPITVELVFVEGPFAGDIRAAIFNINLGRDEVLYKNELVDFKCDLYDKRHRVTVKR